MKPRPLYEINRQQLELIEELDQRQDEILRQLDELTERIEQIINLYVNNRENNREVEQPERMAA